MEFLELLKANAHSNLVSVVLFGSYARGKENETSDVDLLIILEESPSSTLERMKYMISLHKQVKEKTPLSYVVLTRAEAMENRSLFLDMIVEAKILFDKENYFKNRLVSLKARLSEIGAKRIELPDGTWYWDLKPDLKFGEEFEL